MGFSRHTSTLVKLMVVSTVLASAPICAQDVFDEPEDKGYELPDFTKVYGFDVRPDVNLVKSKPKRSESTLDSWKRKLKGKVEHETDSGMRVGVSNYTKPTTGQKKYGLGLSRNVTEKRSVGVTVHGHGVSYDIKNKKSKRNYFLGVDSRTPVSDADDNGAYMYFGIKANW